MVQPKEYSGRSYRIKRFILDSVMLGYRKSIIKYNSSGFCTLKLTNQKN